MSYTHFAQMSLQLGLDDAACAPMSFPDAGRHLKLVERQSNTPNHYRTVKVTELAHHGFAFPCDGQLRGSSPSCCSKGASARFVEQRAQTSLGPHSTSRFVNLTTTNQITRKRVA